MKLPRFLTADAGEKKKQGAVPFINHDENDDDRYMNLSISVHNWQTAFRIIAALLSVSMGFNGYYMMQSKFVPVMVVLDEVGNRVVVGPITESKPIDTERVLIKEISDFIEYSRAVIGDNLLQKKRMRWVEMRLPSSSAATKVVDELLKSRPPFATAETYTYSVDVKSVLRQTNKTYQVEWIEAQRNLSGEVVNTERWKAILTYELAPENTFEGINNNPLGFYVPELSWSRVR